VIEVRSAECGMFSRDAPAERAAVLIAECRPLKAAKKFSLLCECVSDFCALGGLVWAGKRGQNANASAQPVDSFCALPKPEGGCMVPPRRAILSPAARLIPAGMSATPLCRRREAERPALPVNSDAKTSVAAAPARQFPCCCPVMAERQRRLPRSARTANS
jgi:hypothetical protein